MNTLPFVLSILISVVCLTGISASSRHSKVSNSRHSAPAVHLQSPPSSKKCTKELERIVYSPSNPAKEYLLKIAKEVSFEIAAKESQLDSETTLRIIAMIADRYRVGIMIQPPFSNTPNFLIQPGNGFSITPRVIGQVIAPTYLNIPGFNYNSKTGLYSLASYTAGNNGVGYTVIILLAAQNQTFLECK